MNFTPSQLAAIQTDGHNLLISAAAGSGKTAVLTERIARLVSDGADIGRFLVVTFTEAATAEMKRRITARLFKAAQQQERPEAGEKLREQARAVNRANISTLHAFCLYVLRRHFHVLGLDPAFRPDELLCGILFRQAMEETAARFYERDDEGAQGSRFYELLGALSGKEERLFELAEQMHDFLTAQPEPWEWLEAAVAAYDIDESAMRQHPAMQVLLAHGKEESLRAEALLLQARAKVPGGLSASLAQIDEELAQVRALRLPRDWETFCAQLAATNFSNFKTAGYKEYPEAKEEVKNLRAKARDQLSALKKAYSRPLAQEAALLRQVAPHVQTLAAFLREMAGRYDELKQEHGVIDFADMEHFALRALKNEEISQSLRKRFQYIFVDEYQDSSQIQEELLCRIRQENNLFMVGDVKQSIYSFRQAEPGLFLGRLQTYAEARPPYTEEYAPDAAGVAISLNDNFRSSKPVVDAVNGLFMRIMHKETADLDYDEKAALRRPEDAKNLPLDGFEFHIIESRAEAAEADTEADEETGEQPEEQDDEETASERQQALEDISEAQAEARLAAERIHALMQTEQITEAKTGAQRKLRFSDFAILLRAPKAAAQTWAQTLAESGVPAYVQATGGYFDAIEVQVFLNLLKVIDNKRQDIPLLSVLRSPIFHFSAEELITLATETAADFLWERLLAYANGAEETELRKRAAAVLQSLENWRKEQLLQPLQPFLAQLLDETGFYDCVAALPAGRERQGNLDALLSRAEEYAAMGGATDLNSFLAHMEGAKSTADIGGAQAGAADVVRVLSMHKSKGLEYPVVLLAGLGKSLRAAKAAQDKRVLLERRLGLGVKFRVEKYMQSTLYYKGAQYELKRRQMAEEMRVLYVGMTRAQNRLLLLGSVKGAQERLQEAAEGKGTRVASFLDWLLPFAAQSGQWPVQVHTRQMLAKRRQAGEAAKKADPAALAAYTRELRERFSWRYAHEEAMSIPTKRSVSELTETREVLLREAPAFLAADTRLSAAQRGAAAHRILQELQLKNCKIGDEDEFVRRELARMRENGIISARQAEAVRPADISAFLRGGLGRRMLSAPRVEREWEFAMELPASSVMQSGPQAGNGESVLLQGVLDCCFMEDGEWVLLDFKTDRIAPERSKEETANEHAAQLAYYAQALEKLTATRVKERFVVLLRYGEFVPV